MTQRMRLVLALHNHQPIGNFDGVFEQAYQDSYLPFLNVFERYDAELKVAIHTSGSLIEWLDEHHPEYLDRLAALTAAGRVEIIGGAFFEPILAMLPRRDRQGQIASYTRWLGDRLGAKIRGMWMPERVWEQSMVSDLVAAGIEYTALDDFHFKNAGLADDQLHGYYITEDEGHLLKVFPGSERLRYVIPFAEPQETLDYLGEIHARQPGAVAMFADDGEKFGTWPDTKQHVYENGWLERFFDALVANRHWLETATPAEVIDSVPPQGKVYLPDGSYREMTEWALPVPRQLNLDRLRHDAAADPRLPDWNSYIRGGYWRNFKVKYPESDAMYARMLQVSQRLHEAESRLPAEALEPARRELYRGQCNCSFWHGAFGGIYLPHLRNAVYNHLIAADNLLDQLDGRGTNWVEARSSDFNLDARQEVLLASDRLAAYLVPSRGGQLYELDVRSICHNLLATLTRRPEAYHQKVLAGPQSSGESVASIHDRVVFKQANLDQRVQYDTYARHALIDHFFDNEISATAVAAGGAQERGDFVSGVYEARIRRAPNRVQAVLSREGNAWGHPLRITKSITLAAGSSALEIQYLIEGLPSDGTFHFAVEMNLAGLPAEAEGRHFYNAQGQHLGHLGTSLDLHEQTSLGLTDQWLGMDIHLQLSRPTGIWTMPIQTVSQSEAGFELVHQSVAVMPHWLVQGDAEGRWSVTMNLEIDTATAEQRAAESLAQPSLAT